MNSWIESFNQAASVWWSWSLHATWQGLLLLTVLSGVLALWRRATPQLRYGLLLLALIKFTLPPLGISGINFYDSAFSFFSTGLKPLKIDSVRESFVAFESYGVVPQSDTERESNVDAINARTAPGKIAVEEFSPVAWMYFAHILGVALFIALITHRLCKLRALVARSDESQVGVLSLHKESLASEFGLLHRAPRLFFSSEIETPRVGGFLRPFILLPAWVERTGAEEQRLLLAHEFAHVKRRDPICNWFQIASQVWLWWNPLVWALNSRIRAERELCCDDLVLSLNIGSGGKYSRLLVDVAERGARLGEATLQAIGLADSFRHTKGRITRALDEKVARRAKMSLVTLLLLALLAAVALPGGRQEPDIFATNRRAEARNWVADLNNGILVELIGVSTHPSKPGSWWGPDGIPLIEAPYSDLGGIITPDNHERAYEFAVRLRNVPDDFVSSRLQTIPFGSSVDGRSDVDGASSPHTRAIGATLPKDLQSCGLQVEIAAGAWRAAVEFNQATGRWGSYSSSGEAGVFAFSPPIETGSQVVLTLTHNLVHEECRVIAVDKEGHSLQPIRADNQSVGDMIQTTAVFAVLLDQIDHFEVQKRSFEQVMFSDIPLAPGRTDRPNARSPEVGTDDVLSAAGELPSQVPTADFRFNTSDIHPLWKPPMIPILDSWKLVLCAEVINGGSVTQPVRVAFFQGDPKVGGTLIGEVTETVPAGTIIPTIITTGPNGEKIERPGTELPPSPKVRVIQVEWNASPGQYEVYCVLDPQHAVQELDETNNFAHRWVYVKPLLEVANENAALPKHANEKVQAIIDAYNAGNLDAIVPFLNDPDAVTVRQQAIIALGRSYGDLPRLTAHMEPIEKLLFSPSGVDRGAAASALLSREDEFFKRNRDTILRMATDDPDIRVRELVSANLRNSGRSRPETDRSKSEKTGAVHGRASFDGKPWSKGRIVYSRYWPDSKLPYTQPTTTDANGSFWVKELPPGKYHFGILKMWEVESGGMTSAMGTHSHGVYVDVVPGETAEIQIGGSGRRVIGKLVAVPNEEGDSPDLRALEKRYLSGEVPRPQGFEGHIPGNIWVLTLKGDGFFEVPDVPPGDYELMLEQAGIARGASSENPHREIIPTPRRIRISDAGPGEEDKPVDLGEVKVRLYEKRRDAMAGARGEPILQFRLVAEQAL
ncbi:MAG: hypothetical protein HUU16_20115, partial [Candidatus Omnitrophica bacterium]|nr:hypothetical protein [Candidatus Omnitrophota bacterium]